MLDNHAPRGAKYYLKYWLLYSVLFAVVTAGVFLVLILQGRSFVWYSDAVSQYVPRAAYFGTKTREVLAGFLEGDFSIPTYDFTLGMGNTIPLHFEPLYWVFLLFDASQAELAYGVVLLLRFYFAGLSMSVFLFYFRNGWTAALIGSFSYIYCGYGLWACMRHAHFLYGLIMLPLCILALEELYRHKRWYLCTLVVWIHLWCGYYFLYINTLATAVYFLLRFFHDKEHRTFREFWKKLGMIAGSYLLGVAIGNGTLIDSFASYLTSGRTEAVDYGSSANFLFYGWKWPLSFFRDFLTAGRGPGNWLRLGYIPLIYVGLVVLFLRKGRKLLKSTVLTGTVFLMIPAVACVFSGFSNINNRWSYVYSFALSAALAFVIKDIRELTKKERRIVVLASLPFLVLFAAEVLFSHGKNRYIALVSGVVLVLTLVVVLLFCPADELADSSENAAGGSSGGPAGFSGNAAGGSSGGPAGFFGNAAGVFSGNMEAQQERLQSRRLRRWRIPGTDRLAGGALVALTVVSLWCYGLETFAPRMENYASEFPKAGTVVEGITQMPLAALEDVEDDSFYRAATKKVNRKIQGAAQFLDYNGTVWYSSTTSRIMQDYYLQMGVSTWSGVRLKGFDGRTFLDTLACVKYYALDKETEYDLPYGYKKVLETEKNGKTYEVFENEMALPIGYTYDTVISEEELLAYEVPERQEVLMQAASLESAAGTQAESADTSDIKGASDAGAQAESADTVNIKGASDAGAQAESADMSDIKGARSASAQAESADTADIKSADGAVQITGQMAEITGETCENVTVGDGVLTIQYKKGEEATLTLDYSGTENSEVYLYIRGLQYEDGYSASFEYECGKYSNTYSLHGVENPYYSGQKDYLFNLGYHEEADGTCRITFTEGKSLRFDDIQIYCQPMDNMKDYTDALKENVLENVEIQTNCVKGDISLEEEKLLVLSIPYQNGWTAYVDGQKTEIEKANLMYMGIWLEPGGHTIELRYRMPGMRIGVGVSIAAFLIFILLLLKARRRRQVSEGSV